MVQFWLSHNQSQIYSDKLEKLFNESAKLIAEFPEIGSMRNEGTERKLSQKSPSGMERLYQSDDAKA
jgi:hypothetical protein